MDRGVGLVSGAAALLGGEGADIWLLGSTGAWCPVPDADDAVDDWREEGEEEEIGV